VEGKVDLEVPTRIERKGVRKGGRKLEIYAGAGGGNGGGKCVKGAPTSQVV